jgi:DnaK suppressor protein
LSNTPAKKTSPKGAIKETDKPAAKQAQAQSVGKSIVKKTATPTAPTVAVKAAASAKPKPAGKTSTATAPLKPSKPGQLVVKAPPQVKANVVENSLHPPSKNTTNKVPVISKSQPKESLRAASVRQEPQAPASASAATVAAPPPPLPPRTRASSKAAPPPPAQAPLPLPTSRFADRFAPPRPPTRQMNNLGLDTPKHTQTIDPKLANAWKTKAGKDLTEAELLAMPEAQYMSDKQLDFFRTRLQTLKDDLLSNAGETTEHLREETSIVPDPADRATIEEEHALELRTRDRERKLLKKIAQSLIRIDAGDYGFCDETGEPIGLGRLIARPTATLSLEAQQRRELKQKMFGD